MSGAERIASTHSPGGGTFSVLLAPFPGEGPAQEALQSLSRRLQVQEKEMELVKAALAEALRLLRLQAPPTSLQDSGRIAPTRDRFACCHTLSSSLSEPQRASG